MFAELTDELLDLTVSEQGVPSVLWASVSIELCCCLSCCTCDGG
jgi:hypothetical protein